jgi:hypothetical protein
MLRLFLHTFSLHIYACYVQHVTQQHRSKGKSRIFLFFPYSRSASREKTVISPPETYQALKKELSPEKKKEIVEKIESGMKGLPKDKIEVKSVKWGPGHSNTKYIKNDKGETDTVVTVEF